MGGRSSSISLGTGVYGNVRQAHHRDIYIMWVTISSTTVPQPPNFFSYQKKKQNSYKILYMTAGQMDCRA